MPVYGGLVPLGFSHSEGSDFSPSEPGIIIPNLMKKARAAWAGRKNCQCGQGIDHSDIGVAQENDKLGIWRIVRTGHLRTNSQTGVGICLDYQNPDRLPP